MIPAQEALARLREGNRRFVESAAGPGGRPGAGQQPFAIVLGCSDSRVPAELVFGQGFAATLEELRQPQRHESPNLRAIVERIRPAIEPLLATPVANDPAALAAQATRANIRASVNHLRHGSALLERRTERDGLMIVGAEYCVEMGTVAFFDD